MELCTILMYFGSFLIGYIFLQMFNKIRIEPKNFPKGPRSYLPLIGGLLKTGTKPHLHFLKLKKKWGGIFAFDLGPTRIIVLNDYKIIKEAFAINEFNGRNQDIVFQHRQANHEPHGILFNSANKIWSEHRRFTLRNLRDFGFGKSSLQNLVEIEAKDLVENFRKFKGTPVTIKHHFNGPVLSTLWSIMSGYRIEQNDSKFSNFFHKLTEDVKIMPFLLFCPWLFKLARVIPFVAQFIKNSAFALEFMRREIEAHKENYMEGSERDLIDVYLTEIKNSEKNSSFYGIEGELNLQTILNDLFVAGAETSSTTLSWAVHLLAIHPEIQEKVYKEIQSVCQNRSVLLSDKPLLPYTEACILEILRIAAIIPLIPHDTMEDIKNFHGYDIPKGTLIMANMHGALNDPEYWENPEDFQPKRFLSQDGQKIVKHEAFIPFSTGKRICLGETLARDSVFLFFINIVQNFKIVPDPKIGQIPRKIEYTTGAANIPNSFPLIFKERKD